MWLLSPSPQGYGKERCVLCAVCYVLSSTRQGVRLQYFSFLLNSTFSKVNRMAFGSEARRGLRLSLILFSTAY